MKNKVVGAIIIGAGACSGLCSAQSNVTMYGIADLGVVSESGGAGGRVLKVTSGIANGSRLGFKGSEDLGGGMTAIFTMDAGILADTGASAQGGLLFGRQAFVGLAGAAGTLRLGRQYTFIDSSLGALDPFYLGFAGRMSNVFTAGYISRVDNSITYSSPVRGGLSGELAYGFGEVPGDASARRYMGAAAVLRCCCSLSFSRCARSCASCDWLRASSFFKPSLAGSTAAGAAFAAGTPLAFSISSSPRVCCNCAVTLRNSARKRSSMLCPFCA